MVRSSEERAKIVHGRQCSWSAPPCVTIALNTFTRGLRKLAKS